MADQLRSKIIKDNPIGKGLDAFRALFSSICEGANISGTLDALEQLGQEDLQNLVLFLLSTLQILPAARLLRSNSGRALFSELSRLNTAITSDDFDLDRIKPLLKSAITGDPDDVWGQVYKAVTESTPPPRAIASSVQQTPWLYNTSGFANSSEYRKDVDRVLRDELGAIYVGLPRFHEAFFGRIAGLKIISEAVFKKCIEGSEPLFSNGWSGWPTDANQDDVLSWFTELNEKLATFAEGYKSTPTHRRRPLAQPNKPIQGSTAERKLDVGFVDNPKAGKDSRCHWSHILIPGELKSNPSADKASKAWLDLGRYAREVLAAQDTRRFVLGFTICGSLMRIWEFDRLGGIASEQFDINKDGLQFVSTVLGFLWMSEEELGFDPTIMTANDKRFIEIERDGSTERLIIDEVMQRARCIAGRATTCWKAHHEGHPQTPLVIKDSWQYPERDEEGELLREATGQGVVNVARYYYHETVQVRGTDDNIRRNVRGGLDITTATNYRPERSMPPPNMIAKRSCSASPTKASGDALSNRVHRRVILRDYGKPIYEASSRSALLAALEGCIEGHESLRKAAFLHRDISINNLMINEDDDNLSWPSFLIDLDLAVKEQRDGASGAKGKTGTRAFMAIGALLGEQHSFMHDLESFFWVLFWICIHYDAQGKDMGPTEFDSWNYISMELLAKEKKGQVSHEGDFIRSAEENFTPYYQPLVPWINRLRKVVFPNGGRWEKEDTGLYARMREIIGEARKDPKVSAER
ncbi:serine/threonine-protein kinase Sgk2 [Bombardia bombarda]|uniref:non-specific serine/threonine protein kinase n=1 Tax=Bombardia bombarda TaxID=252184 RepID=A0AA39WUG8_9PEZI|nr:serine/threonine-protein kinase Sgk2 [Bombardia bombarda]